MQAMGYNYGHEYETTVYFQSTLAKHHVTQAQFDSSLVWYTDHPLLFNRVYPKVVDRLKSEQEMYEKMNEELLGLREKARRPRIQMSGRSGSPNIANRWKLVYGKTRFVPILPLLS